MKKSFIFTFGALLLAGAASLGSTITTVSAYEKAANWGGYTSTVTDIENGVLVENLTGHGVLEVGEKTNSILMA